MASAQHPLSSNDLARPTLASAYAKYVLHKSIQAQRRVGQAEKLPAKLIPKRDDVNPDAPTSSDFNGRICIVGAGAAGLMVAMCLQAVGIYDFDILEASNRVGGRVFTQPLDATSDPHNYYDVGAMRIPLIPTMQSTLNMIDVLNIKGQTAPYVYEIPHGKGDPAVEPTMYFWKSGIPESLSDAQTYFEAALSTIASDFNGPTLADWDNAFKEYVDDPTSTSNIDDLSTREWLRKQSMTKKDSTTASWDYTTIESAETMETSTGLFDQAFSETIIDYCDFQATTQSDPPKPWIRLEGGMEDITNAMAASVAGTGTPSIQGTGVKVSLNTAVTGMTDNQDAGTITVTTMDTTSNTALPSTDYAAVFNTTALPCLGRMDISGLGLDETTLTGIRALSYDRATKVAIKFSRNWWYPLLLSNVDGKLQPNIGGVSGSDLPISNVVYPSWYDAPDVEGGPEKPAVLMVSYSWAQDATRMGSLVPDYTKVQPQKTDQVVSVCLQNLSKLWASTPGAPSYQDLQDMYVTHHAWAWSHDPWTGGAFALFGPGQFKNLYPAFFQPSCGGRFNICGEATSAHHAWISGALDSAYTTVMTWLCYKNMQTEMAALKASKLGAGVDAHPAEVDETLLHWAAHLSEGYAPLEKA